jgi:hypothetical protein
LYLSLARAPAERGTCAPPSYNRAYPAMRPMGVSFTPAAESALDRLFASPFGAYAKHCMEATKRRLVETLLQLTENQLKTVVDLYHCATSLPGYGYEPEEPIRNHCSWLMSVSTGMRKKGYVTICGQTGVFRGEFTGWLHYFCMNGLFDVALEYLGELDGARAAAELGEIMPDRGCKGDGRSAVHLALMRDAPLELVELMLSRARSPILEVRDVQRGNTPLACAVLRSTDVDVVKLLVRKDPAALHAINADGKRPVDLVLLARFKRVSELSTLLMACTNAFVAGGSAEVGVALERHSNGTEPVPKSCV